MNKFELIMMESNDLVELAESLWWIGNPYLTEIYNFIYDEIIRRNKNGM